MLRHDFCIRRELWRSCSTTYRQASIRLHTNLIPKALSQERLKRLSATLYDERLDMMGIKHLHIQRMLSVDDHTFGVRAFPLTDSQLWMLTFIGHTPNEDGILLSSQLM
jgi:hypothetical protein